MRIGELFSGYGGLGMGVQSVLGGDVVWHSDIDTGACKILAHRYPDVPNLGDITTVDWSQVEPVDVLTGGSPCQDLSHAGRRAGMSEGTRSNLWVAMREAIAALRPPLVIWENVRGAYSAGADSELETRPGLLGSVRRRDGEPVLRALGRVLGDLSDLGYDAQWHGLRAADVGAPHGRFRVFLVATDTRRQRGAQALEHDGRGAPAGDGTGVPDEPDRDALRAGPDRTLLPTPSCSDTNGAGVHGDGGADLRTAVALLPTPRASDGEKGGPNQRGSSGDLMLPAAVHPSRLLSTPRSQNGEPRNQNIWERPADEPQNLENALAHVPPAQLLPTPDANMGNGGRQRSTEALERGDRQVNLNDLPRLDLWGDYAAAIARWETVLGRPAPAPTMTSAKGNPQLSPAFVEWMMGLPAGWVTDVPGITRNEALRALGNGVVPQQCAAALRLMLGQAVAP